MADNLVILDARLTRQMSVGMKAYVRELVQRLPLLAPDLRIIAVTNADLRAVPGIEIRSIGDGAAANASLGEQFALPQMLRRLKQGAKRAITHHMSVYAPRWTPTPYVYTIHDLIHLRYPEYFSWKIPLYYRHVVGPAARRARFVLTDARATALDLAALLDVGEERIRVVPLGVDDRFLIDDESRGRLGGEARRRFGLDQPYALYAGNHRAHKNLETLVRAWQRLEQRCDLALTEDASFTFDLDRYVKPNGRIVRLGHVEADDLLRLYAGCAATVQPSLYEGFGLSVLEGMAAGAPVIVAQTPALLEVAGDAAYTFPPRDSDALALALAAVLAGGEEVERLRARGRLRVKDYTWDATARLTAHVYRETLGG